MAFHVSYMNPSKGAVSLCVVQIIPKSRRIFKMCMAKTISSPRTHYAHLLREHTTAKNITVRQMSLKFSASTEQELCVGIMNFGTAHTGLLPTSRHMTAFISTKSNESCNSRVSITKTGLAEAMNQCQLFNLNGYPT